MFRLACSSVKDLLVVSKDWAVFRGAGIASDIAKGLHFLHSHHVMHLDLKSPNILLAQDGTAKIADVGLSRMFTTRSLPVAKVSNFLEWWHMTVSTSNCNHFISSKCI